MNINLTFLGQMIAFAFFVWFCMRYVWPPIIGAINEREDGIKDSLHAAQIAKSEAEKAKKNTESDKKKVRKEISDMLANAKSSSDKLIEASKDKAQQEVVKLKEAAKQDIDNKYQQAQEEIKQEIKHVAIAIATSLVSESFAKDVSLDDAFVNKQLANFKKLQQSS